MSIFSRLSRQPKIEEKRSKAHRLHFQMSQQAIWSPRNYPNFAREAYQMNVIAFQAINKVAGAVSTIKWQVRLPSGEVVTTHPLLDLMKRPNPMQTGEEWWRDRTSYLLISGDLYDERIVMRNEIRELWVLRPDRMSIHPSKTGMPRAYEYKVGTESKVWPANTLTGDSDINHTKLFNPLDDLYGMSPIEAGAYAVDQHNEAMRWMQALLQNQARPSGALVVNSDYSLTDEQAQRLKAEIEDQYSGAKNAGRPILLEGGLDWKEMGMSPEDMQAHDTKDSAARDISLAFGVPPLLLNIPGDNTYSNYREARLGFYEDTVIPFVNYVRTSFNAWVAPYFDNAELIPDLDSIEALTEKRRGMWQMVDDSDELTVNEARELKGFPPLDGPQGTQLLAELRASTRGHTAPTQAEEKLEDGE